jgi:hypothetical protein
MKKIKRFLWGRCWFWFPRWNHKIDPIVDRFLQAGLSAGIQKVRSNDHYYATVTFKNGVIYSFWNLNRYYAWLHSGTFNKNGETYRYGDARPSRGVMYDFIEALKEAT